MNAAAAHQRYWADTFAATLRFLSASQGVRAGVRCWPLVTGDPEFKALEKEIKINWLK